MRWLSAAAGRKLKRAPVQQEGCLRAATTYHVYRNYPASGASACRNAVPAANPMRRQWQWQWATAGDDCAEQLQFMPHSFVSWIEITRLCSASWLWARSMHARFGGAKGRTTTRAACWLPAGGGTPSTRRMVDLTFVQWFSWIR